jgi:predicted nucleotidyltransferase component of viral defense system
MFHLSTVKEETYQLLQEIFTVEVIQQQFALAGGTSLALQIGHRHSIDLDIFSPSSFDTREIEIALASVPEFNFQLVNKTKQMLFAYINQIKCDFIVEPAKLIRPLIEKDGIKFFSIEDIAAMKMHTICGRGKKKDFFDIYALIELYGWPKMLEWFEEKYDSSQLFFLWRSISYFNDADEDVDIDGYKPYTKSWEEIKSLILKNCL